MQTIYFDYNATTPLDPGVRETMLPFLGPVYGNPSSVHHVGRQARAALDGARERVAAVFHCKPSEIVFTSSGTEANNLAVFGAARRLPRGKRHLITSRVEHHAVLNCFEYLAAREGFQVSYLPVNREGFVSLESLAAAIRPDTGLVSIMAANNETGTCQPVPDLGAFCRERGVLFHTDAVQWFGKEPVSSIHQFNADLVSICGHKFHGPKGCGALFVRSPLRPDPLLFGGGHEDERRAGTENVAAIVGFAAAVERCLNPPVFPRELLAPLSSRLLRCLDSLPGVTFQGSRSGRLNNTIGFTVAGCDSISLLAGLDLEGICVSSGSACSTGSILPSHVLLAMGVDPKLAGSFIRVSLGRESTLGEVMRLEAVLPAILTRVRAGSSRTTSELAVNYLPLL
jgi:cysteine desulfurase